MLVLSRRENDRIVFPTLGISIVVMKLSRSKTSLGIRAPRGIRVIRHELMAEDEPADSANGLVEVARSQATDQLGSQVSGQLKAATKRLEKAQSCLTSGDADHGMRELTAALADLDAIRASLHSAHSPIEFERDDSASSWSTAEKIAEPTTAYAVGDADDFGGGENEHAPKQRLLLVDQDTDQRTILSHSLAQLGYEIDESETGLSVLYELSRSEKPELIVFGSKASCDPETVRQIRMHSQHPEIPLMAFDESGTLSPLDGVSTTRLSTTLS